MRNYLSFCCSKPCCTRLLQSAALFSSPPSSWKGRDHAKLGKKVLMLRGRENLSEYVCKLQIGGYVVQM